MAETIQWENRIVGHGEAPANSFLAHEKNARRHPGKQRESLIGSLNAVGWVAPVIVSKNTGKILDGHARVEEALTRDEHQHIPYVEVDVSESEESLILATLDPITNLATYDKEALDSLLKDVSTGEPALQQMLAELAASQGLYLDSANGTGAGGDGFDSEAALDPEQTRVLKGDLWQLGEHRLLCGDSTKAEDVARVMGSDKAALMNTDPPYGIAFVSNSQSKGQSEGYDEIANDELDGEKLQAFLESCIRVAVPHLTERCAFYLWHPMLTQGTFFAAAAAADILIHRQIIWMKPSMVFGRGDYHWQHELCFYGWRRGYRPEFYGERNQTTIWAIGRENDKIHPTQKPVDLFVIPMRNHTRRGNVVYEPFAGSGSQIIAAEREHRQCRAIELSPEYVNSILTRWEAETQKEAKLLERIV